MILNLHGLNGNSHNTNYKILTEQYPAEDIISPQIDYVMASPTEILSSLKEYKNIDYIVGNSFGGFYAYILSNLCNVPCLLVNPCIPPDKYIPKLVIDYRFSEQLTELTRKYENNHQPTYVILSMEDEVLSAAYTEQILNATKLWKIHGKHSLSGNAEFLRVFKEALKEI